MLNVNDVFAPESITSIIALGMIITKVVKALSSEDSHHKEDSINKNTYKDLLTLNRQILEDNQRLREELKSKTEEILAFYKPKDNVEK